MFCIHTAIWVSLGCVVLRIFVVVHSCNASLMRTVSQLIGPNRDCCSVRTLTVGNGVIHCIVVLKYRWVVVGLVRVVLSLSGDRHFVELFKERILICMADIAEITRSLYVGQAII